VHQLWSLEAVQVVLEVTVKFVVAAGAAVTFWLGGVTDSAGAAPCWVTVTTTGESPATVVVILATLEDTNPFTA
jgi:hypothetical protein